MGGDLPGTIPIIAKVWGGLRPMQTEDTSDRRTPCSRDRRLECAALMSDPMMRSSVQKSLSAIGFLTVARDVEHGLFGGYLVLNALGRPLEFHCTAPVRPSRAQEILYGPTLEPYLVGERIGQTLLEKAKASPQLVFTDIEPAMAAREFVSTPMALVVESLPPAPGPDPQAIPHAAAAECALRDGLRQDAAHVVPPPNFIRLQCVDLGNYRLAVAADYPEDLDRLRQQWSVFAEQIEIVEPFSRIREAIEEARQSTR